MRIDYAERFIEELEDILDDSARDAERVVDYHLMRIFGDYEINGDLRETLKEGIRTAIGPMIDQAKTVIINAGG